MYPLMHTLPQEPHMKEQCTLCDQAWTQQREIMNHIHENSTDLKECTNLKKTLHGYGEMDFFYSRQNPLGAEMYQPFLAIC